MSKTQINKYKGEFTIKFAKLMQENLLIWKGLQQSFKRRLYTKDLWWYLISLLGLIPFDTEIEIQNGYHLNVHLFLCAILVLVIFAILIGVENKNYQTELKKTCFSKLLKVFGEDINYVNYHVNTSRLFAQFFGIIGQIFTQGVNSLFKDSEQNLEVEYNFIENYIFENCGLYNHRIETRTDDDCIYGSYNGVKFIMNETDFGYETGSGKNRHYYSMFKGVAMQFSMPKHINARVLIHTKGLFKYVPRGFEKVNLEYPEFNKKYQVYVNHTSSYEGQIEARYLLNVAFLDRFMQLKTSFRTDNINLSIDGNTMLLMLGTNKDLFEMNHLFGKIDDINQYEVLFNEFSSVLSFIDVLNLSSQTKL